LNYDYNKDADAVKLQKMIKDKGIKEVIHKLCNLDPETDIGEKIIQSYYQFRERFRILKENKL
jgi:mannitol-1-phosphate 5-dehydrogenase